ncbi:vomeronasal type-2 receptor 26-like [Protopterus annectens]|uniref:vomeronasal type-2 receptor 26-like n=1 Tax=Protopterus annectens TaxID=7888 RepID=UPI001CFB7FC8|nr:vomeronasal type-2 receptor 26-like [Protopterus annectens]
MEYMGNPRINLCTAILMADIGLEKVSHAASVSILSNKKEFPSFLRTAPSNYFHPKGIVKLFLHFGWTWAGILASNNDYGLSGSLQLKQELISLGICIEFYHALSTSLPNEKLLYIVDIVKTSSSKVVVIISNIPQVMAFMEKVSAHNVSEKVWIACPFWIISPAFSRKDFSQFLSGTLGLAVHHGDMPGFSDFLYRIHPSTQLADSFSKPFWEATFSCKWLESNSTQVVPGMKVTGEMKLCTGQENLHNVDDSLYNAHSFRYTYNTYNALYAFAYALHELLSCLPGKGPFENGTCATSMHLQPWKIPSSVCSEPCISGFQKTTKQGQPVCCFDCFPCSDGEYSNDTGVSKCMPCPSDQWSSVKRERCIPKVTEFLSYEDPLGTTLAAASILLSQVTLAVLCIFIRHRAAPIVRANNRSLSFLLLFSLLLCFLCPLMFIGYPGKVNCMLRQVAFGVIFSICVSLVLAKTITVIIVFKATNPKSKLKKLIGLKTPYFIVAVCSILQLLICASWLIISPPFPERNMTSAAGKILIECNESSVIFCCMLGYLGLLAFVSFIVAFLVRKLPDTFNEAKFITFSMLVFGMVWLTFIPAYLSTKGKFMVAVEIFAILSSSAGLLACIFFPKCYIILLKCDVNARKTWTRRVRF